MSQSWNSNVYLWLQGCLRKTVVAHKLKGFDFGAFNEMTILTGLSGGCVLQCIESLAKEYDEVLCKALDKLAPKKTRTIVIQPNAPWYNEEITTQKRKRWRLKHKWHSTGLEIDRVNYLEQCNVVKWNHAHPLRVSSLSILSIVTCWWWERGCLSIFKRAIKMFLFSKFIE